MNIPEFYTRDTFAIRVTRNSVTDTTCTDSSQTGYLFCGFQRMPFPHSSSFGYRSRVDLLACVCVNERLCGTRCRLFYFFTATNPATQLHFLHVCVVPILVLHPTRAAFAASGYTCRIRRGMKILVPPNRMENTINSDEHIDDDEQI